MNGTVLNPNRLDDLTGASDAGAPVTKSTASARSLPSPSVSVASRHTTRRSLRSTTGTVTRFCASGSSSIFAESVSSGAPSASHSVQFTTNASAWTPGLRTITWKPVSGSGNCVIPLIVENPAFAQGCMRRINRRPSLSLGEGLSNWTWTSSTCSASVGPSTLIRKVYSVWSLDSLALPSNLRQAKSPSGSFTSPIEALLTPLPLSATL